LVTIAFINGLNYIYVPRTGCYSWDGTTWSNVTLTGLTPSAIIGITGAFGYMIAWSTSAVAWSSTITPTDFTPSLITGAGGGSVQGLEGNIFVCAAHIFGFIVFGQRNCVAAVYSGNARYPFNFRKIIGGGGLAQYYIPSIALDAESGNLYAWTSAGLQIVSVTQAQPVFPELTNFLGGSRFEDFNDGTLAFTETDVTAGTMPHRLAVISDRYLIISYAATITAGPIQLYTHALVYDISMKRWGKLKANHIGVFEVSVTDIAELSPRSNIGLLAADGSVSNVDFSYLATSGGTIILGKYQHARDRMITLEQIDLEYVQSTANVNVYDMVTYDGKTFQPPQLLTAIANTNAPQYPTRLTGMNHSVIIQGIWQLDSMMLTYHSNGRR